MFTHSVYSNTACNSFLTKPRYSLKLCVMQATTMEQAKRFKSAMDCKNFRHTAVHPQQQLCPQFKLEPLVRHQPLSSLQPQVQSQTPQPYVQHANHLQPQHQDFKNTATLFAPPLPQPALLETMHQIMQRHATKLTTKLWHPIQATARSVALRHLSACDRTENSGPSVSSPANAPEFATTSRDQDRPAATCCADPVTKHLTNLEQSSAGLRYMVPHITMTACNVAPSKPVVCNGVTDEINGAPCGVSVNRSTSCDALGGLMSLLMHGTNDQV